MYLYIISLKFYNKFSATNYMAWYHRRLCIDEPGLMIDLNQELDWLDSIIVENQKNYQIWHHRKVIIEKLQDPSHEKKVLAEIFSEEPKNFHAWCHRIWVVRRFSLYEGELDYVENMLEEVILYLLFLKKGC
jgi:protein farnesyltransferase/geranylgeranyltransferase type-1 subunit alpha